MNRHEFLKVCGAGVIALSVPTVSFSQAQPEFEFERIHRVVTDAQFEYPALKVSAVLSNYDSNGYAFVWICGLTQNGVPCDLADYTLQVEDIRIKRAGGVYHAIDEHKGVRK